MNPEIRDNATLMMTLFKYSHNDKSDSSHLSATKKGRSRGLSQRVYLKMDAEEHQTEMTRGRFTKTNKAE